MTVETTLVTTRDRSGLYASIHGRKFRKDSRSNTVVSLR